MNDTLKFLGSLEQNNDKQWFDSNKKTYQKVRNDFLELVDRLISGIVEFDSSLVGVEAKKCLFRINRDIRFSKDKSPYKTNFGAHMAEHGRKSEGTGYYIHAKPNNCFIGGGIYMPTPERLSAIRQEIDYNPDDLIQLIGSDDFKNTFGEIQGDSLKTAPKGYPKDHPHIELLRFKSFYVVKNLSDKEFMSDSFYDDAIETFAKAYEFNKYLNRAMD